MLVVQFVPVRAGSSQKCGGVPGEMNGESTMEAAKESGHTDADIVLS